jgi:hypothetical protein
LKRLSELGLIMPVGEKRGRYYVAAKPLQAIREKCADRTMAPNPYDAIKGRSSGQQLSLPV